MSTEKISQKRIVSSGNNVSTFNIEKVLLNKVSRHIDNGGFEASLFEIKHDVDQEEPFSTYELELSFEYFGYPSTKTVLNLSHISEAKPILEGLGHLCLSIQELDEFKD